ncbi:unnamed protein product [Clonostachys rosea f. rosea IK726]|uniref:Porphobilinogen deaminase n=2 Tax=Bionectria ochroleuca TaxID=29856 RepID=A0A0B7KHW5_BIOOC|nr:unnamed protein product [Clonostachys rosea f. rosea IK726]
MSETTTVNVGTRKSPLAMAQAELVVKALQKNYPAINFEIQGMTTTGDRDQNTALYNFGGKNLWTSQLEDRLRAKELDFVVHCLKDMPTALPDGCVLGAITQREDPRDTLFLESDSGGILWAVGQGALAVECRADDERTLEILRTLEDKQTTLACLAERNVMRTLEGGCSVPIGVETHWVDGKLRLRATVVSVDGTESVETEKSEVISSPEGAEEYGKRVALELVERGAGRILDAINVGRQPPSST